MADAPKDEQRPIDLSGALHKHGLWIDVVYAAASCVAAAF
jgi:hypothetical protein